MKRLALAAVLAACITTVALTTAASSSDSPVRDVNDRPITPGTVVAELVRGGDGQCRPAPGQELGVEGKFKSDLPVHGRVEVEVNHATCKAVVSKVMTVPSETSPPTQHESGGGVRQP